MRVGYRLSPANGRTTLNYSSDRQAHGLMLKLMLPLIIFMSRRKSRGSLQRLKALAES
jgi:hypothetical protein